jgi:hypothetical protein
VLVNKRRLTVNKRHVLVSKRREITVKCRETVIKRREITVSRRNITVLPADLADTNGTNSRPRKAKRQLARRWDVARPARTCAGKTARKIILPRLVERGRGEELKQRGIDATRFPAQTRRMAKNGFNNQD